MMEHVFEPRPPRGEPEDTQPTTTYEDLKLSRIMDRVLEQAGGNVVTTEQLATIDPELAHSTKEKYPDHILQQQLEQGDATDREAITSEALAAQQSRSRTPQPEPTSPIRYRVDFGRRYYVIDCNRAEFERGLKFLREYGIDVTVTTVTLEGSRDEEGPDHTSQQFDQGEPLTATSAPTAPTSTPEASRDTTGRAQTCFTTTNTKQSWEPVTRQSW